VLPETIDPTVVAKLLKEQTEKHKQETIQARQAERAKMVDMAQQKHKEFAKKKAEQEGEQLAAEKTQAASAAELAGAPRKLGTTPAAEV